MTFLKPIAKFIDAISEHEKTVKEIKETDEDDTSYYVTKEDVIRAFQKREEEIKEVIYKYFSKSSHIGVELGYMDEDEQEEIQEG